jgi:hypothetical protein
MVAFKLSSKASANAGRIYYHIHHHIHQLLTISAEPGNWKWLDKDKWTEARVEWQDFCRKWSASGELLSERSFIQSPRQIIEELPDISWIPYNIFIRESYVEMFNKVWSMGLAEPTNGLVITGQPGIGMLFKCLFPL